MHNHIPFIITWGTLCPSAAMTVTPRFSHLEWKEGEFQLGGFSCKSPPLGESHQSTSGSVLPGNKDHLQSKQSRLWFPLRNAVGRQWLNLFLRVCVYLGEKEAKTSGCLQESETQVNGKPTNVSNLFICLEAKKSLTVSLSESTELSSLSTIIAKQGKLLNCANTRDCSAFFFFFNTCYCAS